MTPPQPPHPLEMLRDPRALLDTGLGPVAFVVVNAIWGLHAAAATAIALQVVLGIERLIRRKPVINVIGGLLGTGLAVFIALKTGKATGYFVPRMLYLFALALLFAGSVAIRRPIVGFLVATFYKAEPGWQQLPPVRRAMSELTLAWAAEFGIRAVVYAILIAHGKAGWLAAASLVMGWPAFLALLWLSYRYAPRRLAQLGAPDPRRP